MGYDRHTFCAGSGAEHPSDWNLSYPTKQVSVLEFSGRSVEKMKLFEEISKHGIFHGISI
jgi:hypothetical protein